jgi:sigma-70-like protein
VITRRIPCMSRPTGGTDPVRDLHVTASVGWGRRQPPSGAHALDFDAAWPSAHARMTAALRNRGLQATDVDDIVQEVAVRALRDRQRFVSDEHLVRWCCRVAINLHIDATRRQRRVSPDPPPDVADACDTARTVEQRMTVERLMARIADLSPDEQRLLLDHSPADSRREVVRLAVRRHRLRARLVSLLDGLAAFVPVVRRAFRSLSTPAKVGVTAVPVVACLFIAPFGVGRDSAPADPRSARPAQVTLAAAARVPGTHGPGTAPRHAGRPPSQEATSSKRGATGAPPAPQTLLALNPAGPPVRVTHEQKPNYQPTVCLLGRVKVCVDRPGPALAKPAAPAVP